MPALVGGAGGAEAVRRRQGQGGKEGGGSGGGGDGDDEFARDSSGHGGRSLSVSSAAEAEEGDGRSPRHWAKGAGHRILDYLGEAFKNKKWIETDILVVDCRSEEEYRRSHLSINHIAHPFLLSLSDDERKIQLDTVLDRISAEAKGDSLICVVQPGTPSTSQRIQKTQSLDQRTKSPQDNTNVCGNHSYDTEFLDMCGGSCLIQSQEDRVHIESLVNGLTFRGLKHVSILVGSFDEFVAATSKLLVAVCTMLPQLDEESVLVDSVKDDGSCCNEVCNYNIYYSNTATEDSSGQRQEHSTPSPTTRPNVSFSPDNLLLHSSFVYSPGNPTLLGFMDKNDKKGSTPISNNFRQFETSIIKKKTLHDPRMPQAEPLPPKMSLLGWASEEEGGNKKLDRSLALLPAGIVSSNDGEQQTQNHLAVQPVAARETQVSSVQEVVPPWQYILLEMLSGTFVQQGCAI